MAEKIDTWTLCIYFYTVAHLPNKLTINLIAMLISRSKTFKPNKLWKDEWSVDEVEQRYCGFSIEKQNFTFFRPFSANFPPFYRFRHFFRHKNLSATRLFYRTLLRKMAEKSDTWTLWLSITIYLNFKFLLKLIEPKKMINLYFCSYQYIFNLNLT